MTVFIEQLYGLLHCIAALVELLC